MRSPSRTARRLTLAVLLAAVIPLVSAIFIAQSLVGKVSSLFWNPLVGEELDRSLEVYHELAQAKKEAMRYEADAIAARESLRASAILNHKPSMQEELAEAFPAYPNLVLLGITDADGNLLVQHERHEPLDESKELTLEVRRPLSTKDDGPFLFAKFVTPRARFDELAQASETVRVYRQIESARADYERTYLYAFAALLALTMLTAVAVGTLLARGVTARIGQLAKATEDVGAGDLSVRVPESGNDEITDLAHAFNAMLTEVERSRARIEFLQRMGTWQEMARRLAHEIKNPLTPIQLAVEECYWRYKGEDQNFKALLDMTLKIVEEEVGTLRRLVTEFSAFARLPRAELREADLGAFLREQAQHMVLFSDDESGLRASDADVLESSVEMTWHIPNGTFSAYIDPQMLHRVLINLVRNAAQAVRERPANELGSVVVALRKVDDDWIELVVEDDGPGIAEEVRDSIFDPYVTTKTDGTGLGLSIVKKIVMEHGGAIDSGTSSLGGAKITVRLPRAGSPASIAAREHAPVSNRASVRPAAPADGARS